MRRLLVVAIMSTLGPLCGAEVIRCADAAGNVSYTDGTCPAGSRQVGRVTIPEPSTQAEPPRPQRNIDITGRVSPPPSEAMDAARRPPAPSGPVIIDSRGGNGAERQGDSRWSEPLVIDDGYAYPGSFRQPRPPRDMRPRIRNCDATGCQDTQGNHYDRSGQLDRYQSLDGKNCRPVGTTTICR
jgi:hypothetical protein